MALCPALRVSATAEVPVSRMMGFADGGALDNLAVMPLLRRGVKCLIVLAAASHAPGSGLDTFAEGE